MSILPDGGLPSALNMGVRVGKPATVADSSLPLSDMVPNVRQAAPMVRDFVKKLCDSSKAEDGICGAMPCLAKLHYRVIKEIGREGAPRLCAAPRALI